MEILCRYCFPVSKTLISLSLFSDNADKWLWGRRPVELYISLNTFFFDCAIQHTYSPLSNDEIYPENLWVLHVSQLHTSYKCIPLYKRAGNFRAVMYLPKERIWKCAPHARSLVPNVACRVPEVRNAWWPKGTASLLTTFIWIHCVVCAHTQKELHSTHPEMCSPSAEHLPHVFPVQFNHASVSLC